MEISITINGQVVNADVEPRTLLVQFIVTMPASPAPTLVAIPHHAAHVRFTLTVRREERTVLAVQADGGSVTTIEGMASADGTFHPMQRGVHG